MSCYGCGSSFGAFKKEHGCKNCGFAFCTKCLPNKFPIERMNNEKHRVCMKCYNILTGKVKPKEDDTAKYSPPENYKKRVAALAEREGTGGRGPKPTHHAPAQRKPAGISQADWDIQQRLEKLKEKSPAEKAAGQVSETELGERLARMKGVPPEKKQPTYQPPERRSQQKQMEDLLNEIADEVELDARLPDPVTEISARLAKLKQPYGQDKNTESNANNESNASENNLNKPSLRDSQTFSSNFSQSKDKIMNEGPAATREGANTEIRSPGTDREINEQDISNLMKEAEQSDSENEEIEIVKRALEENRLDEASARDGVTTGGREVEAVGGKQRPQEKARPDKKQVKKMNDQEWYDPDELPYCCICTEDAVVRCLGCDHDLYCQQCFKEGHEKLGLSDHVTIKYTPQEGTS
ncbi:ANCHR-like protein [Mya arenaria]|uniref:ANCHR-like protein n=1 Tax=Mya arenaria TaxID=6604 RepID=A0ABY7FF22_MYAAR|nr:ANCHR-like protein [Mya arenaria]